MAGCNNCWKAQEFTGKKLETYLVPALAGVKARNVLVLGLGAREKCDQGVAYRAAGAAAKALSGKKLDRVAFYACDSWNEAQQIAAIAGAINGCIGQDLYRAKKARQPFNELLCRV